MVPAEASPLELGSIFLGLLGGLALFLFGLEQLTGALKLAGGDRMGRALARLTSNRYKAAFAGAFVTAVIQSSSVTTVLVVGFVSAGLLSFTRTVGVIIGANVGSTVTAQIIAFKVVEYALLLVAVGFGLRSLAKAESWRQIGTVLLGLGLVFLGMKAMGDGTYPLRDYPPFIDLLGRLEQPALAILASAAFTALIQSSAATAGIVIVLAGQGLISLETGIALVFGANIGTCATAALAALGKPREAVRVAVVHTIVNVLGVVAWYAFVPQLAELVRWLSPAAGGLSGAARLAAETPRQVANAHTFFNLANTLLLLPFVGSLARLVCWLVPDRPRPLPFRHLQPSLLETPGLALAAARLELGRLGKRALAMAEVALDVVVKGSASDLRALRARDDDVDALHGAIVTYLGQLSLRDLTRAQSRQSQALIAVANHLESIGDMIETNLVEAGERRVASGVQISTSTRLVIAELHAVVCDSVETAVTALVADETRAAVRVLSAKQEVDRLATAADTHLARRLTADEPNRLSAFRIESDVIENLRRIHYFAKRIAKLVPVARDATGAVERSPGGSDGQGQAEDQSREEEPQAQA